MTGYRDEYQAEIEAGGPTLGDLWLEGAPSPAEAALDYILDDDQDSPQPIQAMPGIWARTWPGAGGEDIDTAGGQIPDADIAEAADAPGQIPDADNAADFDRPWPPDMGFAPDMDLAAEPDPALPEARGPRPEAGPGLPDTDAGLPRTDTDLPAAGRAETAGALSEAEAARPEMDDTASGNGTDPAASGYIPDAGLAMPADSLLAPRPDISLDTPLAPEGKSGRPEAGGFYDPVAARRLARMALASAGEYSPALIADMERAAAELGVSQSLVAAAPQVALDELDARRLAANPDLNHFAAQSPENAALARAHAGWAAEVHSAFSPLNDGLDIAGAAASNREAAAALAAGVLDVGKNTLFAMWNGLVGINEGFWGAMAALADNLHGPESSDAAFARDQLAISRQIKQELPADAGAVEKFWYDFWANGPQMLAGMGVGLGATAIAGPVAGAAASSAFMGSQIFGTSYNELRQKGIDPQNAAFGASVNAALQAPLEYFSYGRLLRIVRNPGESTIRDIAGASVGEFITEAMQKAPEYVGHAWAESSLHARDIAGRWDWFVDEVTDSENLAKAGSEAIYEGLIGAAWGGVAAGASHLARRRAGRDAATTALLEEAREAASQNAARRMLDEAFSRAREARQAGHEAMKVLELSIPARFRKLWIAPDDLAGLISRHGRQKTLQALGLDGEQAATALEMKQDMQVDTALVLNQEEEIGQEAADALRLEPGGPTAAQAAGWSAHGHVAQMAQMLREDGEIDEVLEEGRQLELARQARAAHTARQGARREISRLKREMIAAGLGDPEASAQCGHIMAHAMAFYEVYGVDPARLLATRYHVRAAGEPPAPDSGSVIRGQTSFMADGSAIISIFRSANTSTMAHEAAHVYIDDLRSIAADNGSSAIAGLRSGLDELAAADPAYASAADSALDLLSRELPNGPEKAAAEMLRHCRLYAHHASQTMTICRHTLEYMERQEEQDEAEMERQRQDMKAARASHRVWTRLASRTRKTLRHLEALKQARQDMATLAAHAGVTLDDLADTTAWTTLQERAASDFTAYLHAGKSPSMGLADVFSRLSIWLTRLFGHENSATLPGEINAVFDRLLATDREISRAGNLDLAAAFELELLDSSLFTDAERRKMKKMLDKKRQQAAMALDDEMAAALRRILSRQKNADAGTPDAATATTLPTPDELLNEQASEHPAWEIMEAGHVSSSDAVEILGQGMVEKLNSIWPDLFTEKGQPLAEVASQSGIYDSVTLCQDIQQQILEAGITPQTIQGERAALEARIAASQAAGRLRELQDTLYAEALTSLDTQIALKIAEGSGTPESIAQRAWTGSTPQAIISQMAAAELAPVPISSINMGKYRNMLQKALSERAQAIRDGNLFAARNALTRARIANECMLQATAIRNRAEKVRKLAATITRSARRNYPEAHAEACRRILEMSGLGRLPVPLNFMYSRSTVSLRELVASITHDDELDAMEPSIAPWILDGLDPATGQPARFLHWQTLTQSQLRDVEDILNYIHKSAMEDTSAHARAEKSLIKSLVDKCCQGMTALSGHPRRQFRPNSALDTAQRLISSIYSSVDQLRFQFAKGDGLTNVLGKGENGPLGDILDAMQKQENIRRGMVEKFHLATAPHFRQLARTCRALQKNGRCRIDDHGRALPLPAALAQAYKQTSWTPDMLMALALNCGTESNMARIRGGYRDIDYDALAHLLGDDMARAIFRADHSSPGPHLRRPGLLQAADWRAVQGIWDAIAQFWPDTVATHRRMFGFEPEAVPVRASRLLDAAGEAVYLEGGYYPVRYDPAISTRVAGWSEQDDILSRNDSILQTPSARHGFTEKRASNNPGLPLLLNTSIISQHVHDATTFITMAEITRKAHRIIRDTRFRSHYVELYGQQDYDYIIHNLRGLVRREPPPRYESLAQIANVVRKYLVPWGLAYNFKVAALQMTAVFPAMGDIGVKPMLHALAHMSRHGFSTLRKIYEVSPYLKSRLFNIDQDIQKAMGSLSPDQPFSLRMGSREITWESLVNAGMLPIVAVDAAATGAVWIAAYHQKISSGSSHWRPGDPFDLQNELHAEAVRYADNMVKQSNPDFDATSRSFFTRSQGISRLVNQFSSAITLFAARGHFMRIARKKGRVSAARMTRFYMFDYILPATAMYLLMATVWGLWDEEPEEQGKYMLSFLMDNASMALPVFGSMATESLQYAAGLDRTGARNPGLRTSLDAPFQLFGAASNILHKTAGSPQPGTAAQIRRQIEQDEEFWKQTVYTAADIASFIMRVPISRIARRAGQGYEQWQSGHGTPLSTLSPRPRFKPDK